MKCQPTEASDGEKIGGCGRELIPLVPRTKRKGLVVYVCPRCDGRAK